MSYYDEIERISDHSLMWITIDSRAIPVSGLEDDHVLNIERMLRGEGEQDFGPGPALVWYPVILREMYRRKLKPLPGNWINFAQ